MSGYLPNRDAEFDEWVDNFIAYAGPRLEQMGFTPSDFEPIDTAVPEWKNALNTHLMWKAQTKSKREEKDQHRSDLSAMIRAFVARVQASPLVTDADRLGMGITVRSSAQIPSTLPAQMRPTGRAIGGAPLKHIVSFENAADAGVSKAKPAGVRSCEIWVKIGQEPSGPSELTYVKSTTRTRTVVDHEEQNAGKTAYYRLRWIDTHGNPGTWSDVFQATIAA